MARKIEVVPYNPQWPALFEEEAAKIQNVLGDNCISVHHIGSTSVPGLYAKPVIDMIPVVKDIQKVDGCNLAFEKLGYQCMGEYGITGRRFFMKGGDDRTHHVHVFEVGDTQNINRHLAVRDFLRTHLSEAEEYAKLKIQLAAQFTYDNDGYCDGKDEFVKSLEQKALLWQRENEQSNY